MKSMNVSAAKTHFSSVVDSVERGETVLICKRNVPVAKMVSVSPPAGSGSSHRTRIGWAKDTGVRIRADLTEPALPSGDWEMMK